jgi:hypothetical protein
MQNASARVVNNGALVNPPVLDLPLVPYLAARLGISAEEAQSKLGDCLLLLAAERSRAQRADSEQVVEERDSMH